MDIFLATGQITKDTLFLNGLHQNCLTLYSLFESLGYRPHCLTDCSGSFLDGYRSLEPETYVQNPSAYRLCLYIEIATTFDSAWRAFLRRKGVRTSKLHLGNSLLIDVEMTHVLHQSFQHHAIGSYDEIWTSPHYARNCAYLSALYRTPCRTVPYVWSSQWIEGAQRYVKPASWTTADLVVAEPNISVQKHCLYPLLLAEAFAQRTPEWQGRLILQNTERFQVNVPMQQRLAASPLKDRIVLKERMPLASILAANPSATFLSYQRFNEYNYMTLELLFLGYPLLHNSEPWSSFGAFWDEEEWDKSLDSLRQVIGSERRTWDLSMFSIEQNKEAWREVICI